jgi:hypothetical protein
MLDVLELNTFILATRKLRMPTNVISWSHAVVCQISGSVKSENIEMASNDGK